MANYIDDEKNGSEIYGNADDIAKSGTEKAKETLKEEIAPETKNVVETSPSAPVKRTYDAKEMQGMFSRGEDYSDAERNSMSEGQYKMYQREAAKYLDTHDTLGGKEVESKRGKALDKEAEELAYKARFVAEESEDPEYAEYNAKYKRFDEILTSNGNKWKDLTEDQRNVLRNSINNAYDYAEKQRGHDRVFWDAIQRGYWGTGRMIYQGWEALTGGGSKESEENIRASVREGELEDILNPQRIGSTSNINNVGDALDWVGESIGENLVRGAVATGAAMAGAAAAPVVLPGVAWAGTAGAIAFGTAGTMAMNTGEAVQDQISEEELSGGKQNYSRGYAALQGLGYSLLDGAFGASAWAGKLWGNVLSKMGKSTVDSAMRDTALRAGLGSAAKEFIVKGVLGEGAQEVAQSQLVGRGRRLLQSGSMLKTGEDLSDAFLEAWDEFAGGAVAGIGMGGPAAIYGHVTSKNKYQKYTGIEDLDAYGEQFKNIGPEIEKVRQTLNSDSAFGKFANFFNDKGADGRYAQMLIARHVINDHIKNSNVVDPKLAESCEKSNEAIDKEIAELRNSNNKTDKAIGDLTRSYIDMFNTTNAKENFDSTVSEAQRNGMQSQFGANGLEESIEPNDDGSRNVFFKDNASGISVANKIGADGKDGGWTIINNPSFKQPILGDDQLVFKTKEEAIEMAKKFDIFNQARVIKNDNKVKTIKQVFNKLYGQRGAKLDIVDRDASMPEGTTAAAIVSPKDGSVTVKVNVDGINSIGELYNALVHERSHEDIAELIIKSNNLIGPDGKWVKDGYKRFNEIRDQLMQNVVGADEMLAKAQAKAKQEGKENTWTQRSEQDKKLGRTNKGYVGEELLAERKAVDDTIAALMSGNQGLIGTLAERIQSAIKMRMAADMGLSPMAIMPSDVAKVVGVAFERGYAGLKPTKTESNKVEESKTDNTKTVTSVSKPVNERSQMKNGDGQPFAPGSIIKRNSDNTIFTRTDDGKWRNDVGSEIDTVDDATASEGGYTIISEPTAKNVVTADAEGSVNLTGKPVDTEAKTEEKPVENTESREDTAPVAENTPKTTVEASAEVKTDNVPSKEAKAPEAVSAASEKETEDKNAKEDNTPVAEKPKKEESSIFKTAKKSNKKPANKKKGNLGLTEKAAENKEAKKSVKKDTNKAEEKPVEKVQAKVEVVAEPEVKEGVLTGIVPEPEKKQEPKAEPKRTQDKTEKKVEKETKEVKTEEVNNNSPLRISEQLKFEIKKAEEDTGLKVTDEQKETAQKFLAENGGKVGFISKKDNVFKGALVIDSENAGCCILVSKDGRIFFGLDDYAEAMSKASERQSGESKSEESKSFQQVLRGLMSMPAGMTLQSREIVSAHFKGLSDNSILKMAASGDRKAKIAFIQHARRRFIDLCKKEGIPEEEIARILEPDSIVGKFDSVIYDTINLSIPVNTGRLGEKIPADSLIANAAYQVIRDYKNNLPAVEKSLEYIAKRNEIYDALGDETEEADDTSNEIPVEYKSMSGVELVKKAVEDMDLHARNEIILRYCYDNGDLRNFIAKMGVKDENTISDIITSIHEDLVRSFDYEKEDWLNAANKNNPEKYIANMSTGKARMRVYAERRRMSRELLTSFAYFSSKSMLFGDFSEKYKGKKKSKDQNNQYTDPKAKELADTIEFLKKELKTKDFSSDEKADIRKNIRQAENELNELLQGKVNESSNNADSDVATAETPYMQSVSDDELNYGTSRVTKGGEGVGYKYLLRSNEEDQERVKMLANRLEYLLKKMSNRNYTVMKSVMEAFVEKCDRLQESIFAYQNDRLTSKQAKVLGIDYVRTHHGVEEKIAKLREADIFDNDVVDKAAEKAGMYKGMYLANLKMIVEDIRALQNAGDEESIGGRIALAGLMNNGDLDYSGNDVIAALKTNNQTSVPIELAEKGLSNEEIAKQTGRAGTASIENALENAKNNYGWVDPRVGTSEKSRTDFVRGIEAFFKKAGYADSYGETERWLRDNGYAANLNENEFLAPYRNRRQKALAVEKLIQYIGLDEKNYEKPVFEWLRTHGYADKDAKEFIEAYKKMDEDEKVLREHGAFSKGKDLLGAYHKSVLRELKKSAKVQDKREETANRVRMNATIDNIVANAGSGINPESVIKTELSSLGFTEDEIVKAIADWNDKELRAYAKEEKRLAKEQDAQRKARLEEARIKGEMIMESKEADVKKALSSEEMFAEANRLAHEALAEDLSESDAKKKVSTAFFKGGMDLDKAGEYAGRALSLAVTERAKMTTEARDAEKAAQDKAYLDSLSEEERKKVLAERASEAARMRKESEKFHAERKAKIEKDKAERKEKSNRIRLYEEAKKDKILKQAYDTFEDAKEKARSKGLTPMAYLKKELGDIEAITTKSAHDKYQKVVLDYEKSKEFETDRAVTSASQPGLFNRNGFDNYAIIDIASRDAERIINGTLKHRQIPDDLLRKGISKHEKTGRFLLESSLICRLGATGEQDSGRVNGGLPERQAVAILEAARRVSLFVEDPERFIYDRFRIDKKRPEYSGTFSDVWHVGKYAIKLKNICDSGDGRGLCNDIEDLLLSNAIFVNNGFDSEVIGVFKPSYAHLSFIIRQPWVDNLENDSSVAIGLLSKTMSSLGFKPDIVDDIGVEGFYNDVVDIRDLGFDTYGLHNFAVDKNGTVIVFDPQVSLVDKSVYYKSDDSVSHSQPGIFKNGTEDNKDAEYFTDDDTHFSAAAEASRLAHGGTITSKSLKLNTTDAETIKKADRLVNDKVAMENILAMALHDKPLTPDQALALSKGSAKLRATLINLEADQTSDHSESIKQFRDTLDKYDEAMARTGYIYGSGLRSFRIGFDISNAEEHMAYLVKDLESAMKGAGLNMRKVEDPSICVDLKEKDNYENIKKKYAEAKEEIRKYAEKVAKLSKELEAEHAARLEAEARMTNANTSAELERIKDEAYESGRASGLAEAARPIVMTKEEREAIAQKYGRTISDYGLQAKKFIFNSFGKSVKSYAGKGSFVLTEDQKNAFAAILKEFDGDVDEAVKFFDGDKDIESAFRKFAETDLAVSEAEETEEAKSEPSLPKRERKKRAINKKIERGSSIFKQKIETAQKEIKTADKKYEKKLDKLTQLLYEVLENGTPEFKATLGEFARAYAHRCLLNNPDMTNEQILEVVAREMGYQDRTRNYTVEDAKKAISGEDGYRYRTKQSIAVTKAKIYKARKALEEGKGLKEVAKELGIDYTKDAEIVDAVVESLEKMLAAQVESIDKSIEDKEASDKIRANIKRITDSLHKIKTSNDQLEAVQEFVELAGLAKKYRKDMTEKERLQNQLDEWERRIDEEDFETHSRKRVEPKNPAENETIRRLQMEIRMAQKNFANAKRHHQWKKMGVLGKSWTDTLDLLSMVKGIAGSLDFSSFLRQGGQMTWAHPIMAVKSFRKMLGVIKNQKMADDAMIDIMCRDTFPLMERAGIEWTEYGNGKVNYDDRFIPLRGYAWFTKLKPVQGSVAWSERAFAMYLNIMRANMFDYLVAHAEKKFTENGVEGWTDDELKKIGNMINIASQRAAISSDDTVLKKSIEAANYVLWSPRNFISRVQFIKESGKLLLSYVPKVGNKINLYGKGSGNEVSEKIVRDLIAKELARYVAGVSGAILFTKMFRDLFRGDDEPPEDMVLDPRSSDFLKIKFGNTRVDYLSGLQQIMVFSSRFWTGEKTNLRGQTHKLNSRYDLTGRFLRSKLSPLGGMVWDWASGETFDRQDITWDPRKALINNKEEISGYRYLVESTMFPLTGRDLVEQLKYTGVGPTIGTFMLTALGAGVQAFDPYTYKQMKEDFRYFKRLRDDTNDPAEKRRIEEYHPMLKRAGSIEAQIKNINRIEKDIKRLEKFGSKPGDWMLDNLEREKKRAINLMAGFKNPFDTGE